MYYSVDITYHMYWRLRGDALMGCVDEFLKCIRASETINL
jgi:hypothetical protein